MILRVCVSSLTSNVKIFTSMESINYGFNSCEKTMMLQ